MSEFRDHDTGNHHAYPHDNGSYDQHRLTSNLVNNRHRRKSANEEDNSCDSCGEECLCASSQTERLEDITGIVDNRIDTYL
jgi:hypothetical protein